jgi:hypothetical protein
VQHLIKLFCSTPQFCSTLLIQFSNFKTISTMCLKKIILIALPIIFASSCNKHELLSDEIPTVKNIDSKLSLAANDGQLANWDNPELYSQNPSVALFREMFSNHLKHHATVEPWGYLPQSTQGTFRVYYEQEKALFNNLGHDAWVDRKVQDGSISYALGLSMKTINTTLNGINDANIGSLVPTLRGQRNSLTLMTEEQVLAELMYDIILSTINQLYPPGGINSRIDPCKLSDLIGDIANGIKIGATVGQVVSVVLQYTSGLIVPEGSGWEVLANASGAVVKVKLQVIGGIIGGIIGGVVGILNGDDCDCGAPLGISIVTPNNPSCALSYQLYAWGAGDDAEFFDWTVNEGNSSAFFPGEPPLLSNPVTQASPNVPLLVSVTALCADAMNDPSAMGQNTLTAQQINLFGLPINEVGNILVFSNYNTQSTITEYVGNSSTFDLSSTAGMGNNTYSVSVFPPNLGTVIQNPSGSFSINWTSVGAGTIRFTGTNTCSGLQNTLIANVIIN